MRLQGQVGVVTGAGRGLGRAIATALAAEGMRLALVARTGEQVRSLAEELERDHGARVLPVAADVTDPAAIDRLVMHTEQQLGPVDLLVNNAARIESAEVAFWESDRDELWAVVETNLRGPLLLTRALLPPMVARGRGHVVTLTSRARAATRTGTYTGYAVSKRALTVLTESLTAPLAGTGVVVLDVLPGLVRTSMTLSMPVWDGTTDWDDPDWTARTVVEAALGLHDEAHGGMLDAPALHRRAP